MANSDYSQGFHCIIYPQAGMGVAPVMSQTGTDQLYMLGMSVQAEDKNSTAGSQYLGVGEFVYVRGSNVTARGQFCHIVSNSAVLLASANSASFYPIGLAAGALSATNVYGWVQVAGLADYATHTNNNVAAGALLFMAITAGQLQSAGTSLGRRVQGVVCPVSYGQAAKTASAPNMTVQLNHPHAWGISASN